MTRKELETNPLKAASGLLVSALLCFSLLPSVAWAAEGDTASGDAGKSEGSPSGSSSDDVKNPDENPPAAEEPSSGDDGQGDGSKTDDSQGDSTGGGESGKDQGGASGDTPGTGTEDVQEPSDSGEKKESEETADKGDSSKEKESSEESEEEVGPWVQKKIDAAREGIADSNSAMGQLPGALSGLRSAQAAFDEAYDDMDTTERELADVTARMEMAKKRSSIARPAALSAQTRLDEIGDAEPHTFAVKNGMSLMEANTRLEQLTWIAESATAVADGADAEYADCEKRKAELSDMLVQKHQSVDELLAQANSCAYEAEICCSEARSGEVAAQEALADIGGKVKAADEVRSELESTRSSHSDVRYSAFGVLDSWYSDLDARTGTDEARLTFGTGLDFAMGKEAFVAKWAPVIDEYYSELGGTPLSGYGELMAQEAWEWKIDPRLCAAVSFTESGGGRVCIRNCNAWGWGAADTDPYNLASEWGSWEEAISSWYRGMGTNGMGLATARAVDELGGTYAGAPHWTRNVVNAMQHMEEIARSHQANASNLSVASK